MVAVDRGKKGALREVLLVYAGVMLWTGLVTIAGGLLPFLAPYQGVLIALAFLYAPVVAVRCFRRPLAHGRKGTAWSSMALSLGMALVIFGLFLVGNHVWRTQIEQRQASWKLDRQKGWPLEWEGAPGAGATTRGSSPLLYTSGGRLTILNPPDAAATLRVEYSAAHEFTPFMLGFSRGAWRKRNEALMFKGELAPGQGIGLPALSVDRLRLSGAAVVRVGYAASREELPFSSARGWLWWLWLLANQIILIALPEEIFYRGYLQQRLVEVFPGGLRILGAPLGAAILLTSLLFAVGHLVTIPAPFRLAVFFPSIWFGWLRERTQHLAGPVLVHALSNLLMTALIRFYM